MIDIQSEARVKSFDLSDVAVLGGPFKHAMDLNKEYLLQLEPDRFLARFREYAGLEIKAAQYDGWETMTLSGHSLGHYLSACSMLYASLKDERFKERVDYIVNELTLCQDAHGNGYVSGIPNAKEVFQEEVAKGDIRSKGFDLNGLWAPLYTIHKLLAGLRDALHLVGNPGAKDVAVKLADWLYSCLYHLDDDQMETLMICEYGGINEVLADLYADTGDIKYLNLAQRFWHKPVLGPLSEKKDSLPGIHANTQIPKLIGVAREYELTNDVKLRDTAAFFWEQVVEHHSYVIGGNSFEEYFGEPDQLSERIGPHTTETCNTYNMLKLTNHIFEWSASVQAADFYERAMLNHILSSQHPEEGGVTYCLSLDMGGFKDYNRKFNDFTCCVGTGMENHSSYGKGIYFHGQDELYVNQFIPSSLNWKEKGVNIIQDTSFPEDDSITLNISCENDTPFSMHIRYPYWAKKGVELSINGNSQWVDAKPGSFIEIDRLWQEGDVVEVKLPMSLHTEKMPDNPKRLAIMYGPLVLAGELGPLNDPTAAENLYTPVMIPNEKELTEWLQPIPGKRNSFVTVDAGHPRDVELYPFYRMHDKMYSVYWDVFTEAEWEKLHEEYLLARENLKILEKSTIDYVQPGEMQPERDHNFDGENTRVGSLQNRKCRTAYDGWFSFDLRVNQLDEMLLVISYANDMQRRESEYDIYVEGKRLNEAKDGFTETTRIHNVTYHLPKEIYQGKDKVTVKFQAHKQGRVRRVFGLRMVNENEYTKLVR